MSKDLLCSIDDAVGFVTLNRPQVHNAISCSMWVALPEMLVDMKTKGVRVVVFTGQGSSFASGADLSELKEITDYQSARKQWLAIKNSLDFVAAFELPTISMINGACFGGGLLLALATDVRIASDNSSFAIPIARLGIVLDSANISRLVDVVGPACAKEILFSGNTISSARAERIGLVNHVVNARDLQDETLRLARLFLANAPISLSESKKAINKIAAARSGTKPEPNGEERLIIDSYLSSEFKSRINE
jgi:enoyl-CoA hydratase